MGIKMKAAKGPNPLSVKRKMRSDGGKTIKKRLRKGKRSKELSSMKKNGSNGEGNGTENQDKGDDGEVLEPNSKPKAPFETNTPLLINTITQ